MPVNVTITTADADPLAAPHKVSKKAGKEIATAKVDVSGTGPVRALRVNVGGTNVKTGKTVLEKGAVTGLARCGVNKPAAIPNPSSHIATINANDLLSEGVNQVGVYVYNGDIFE